MARADILEAITAAEAQVTDSGGLRVFAAGSLRPAFAQLADAGEPGALSFQYANARDLAERIEAGEPVDVFASASPEHPRALHSAGLVGAPRPFASNALVVAVPDPSDAQEFTVLAPRPGRGSSIEVEGIPLGDYTRELLDRLDELDPDGFATRVFANVVAEEQTVDHVAALLLDDKADAAVLYATDIAARPGQLRAIELPHTAAVQVTYVACVVTATEQPDAAAAWVDGLNAPRLRRSCAGRDSAPPA